MPKNLPERLPFRARLDYYLAGKRPPPYPNIARRHRNPNVRRQSALAIRRIRALDPPTIVALNKAL